MKALSIRQPWASLIVDGFKDIENRSWPTKFRGKILVHASKKFDMEAAITLGLPCYMIDDMKLWVGGIIGEVEITDCVIGSNSDWFEGPYGFVLKNAKRREFKPYKGKLGLFEVEL